MTLQEYVIRHTLRGSCTCGKCVDAPDQRQIPPGHTIDVGYFKVAIRNNPDVETFKELIRHTPGSYQPLNPFDGQPHNFMEVGGWLGDQGVALMFMALGEGLGLWKVHRVESGDVLILAKR